MKPNFYISKPSVEAFIKQATSHQTPGELKNVYIGISTHTADRRYYITVEVATWVIDEVYVPMICRFETESFYLPSEHPSALKEARLAADKIKEKILDAGGFNVYEGHIATTPISINFSTQSEI